jgi:hypothetical protein
MEYIKKYLDNENIDISKSIYKKYNPKLFNRDVFDDIPLNSKNRYYIDVNKLAIKYNNEIHDDIKVGLNLIFNFLEDISLKSFFDKDIIEEFEKNIIKLNPKLRLIRCIIKESIEDLNIEGKIYNYNKFYGLESFLGYRMDSYQKSELIKQWNQWTDKNILIYKYGEKQKQLINEYYNKLINIKVDGMSITDVVNKNEIKYNNTKEILGNINTIFNSSGVATGEKLLDKDRLSKTQLFMLTPYLKELCNPRTPTELIKNLFLENKNKVIIKRETIKMRTVINATLRTYIPLNKLNIIATKILKGMSTIYTVQTKEQKSLFYRKILQYIKYNKEIMNRYLILPLDYSSFDRSFTIELIRVISNMLANVINNDNIKKDIIYNQKQFEDLLKEEILYFNLDKEYSSNYIQGMLSGWKITNSYESIGNYLITLSCLLKLGINQYSIEYLCTMGDDLIIIIDTFKNKNIFIEHNLQRNSTSICNFISDLSNCFKEINFIINPFKNMYGFDFAEYLRVMYYYNYVAGYPFRATTSLYYIKPTSEIEFNNIVTVESNIQKYILKTNNIINKKFLLQKYCIINKNININKYGYDYLMDKEKYKLEKIFINLNNIKLDDDISYKIKNSTVFNNYLNIIENSLNITLNDIELEQIVHIYFNKVIRKQSITYNIVEIKNKNQRNNSRKRKILIDKNEKEIQLIVKTFNYSITHEISQMNIFDDYIFINFLCDIYERGILTKYNNLKTKKNFNESINSDIKINYLLKQEIIFLPIFEYLKRYIRYKNLEVLYKIYQSQLPTKIKIEILKGIEVKPIYNYQPSLQTKLIKIIYSRYIITKIIDNNYKFDNIFLKKIIGNKNNYYERVIMGAIFTNYIIKVELLDLNNISVLSILTD